MPDAEERAWRQLQSLAPRGRYEHPTAWGKRNRRRASFLVRIRRDESGCWVWTGSAPMRGGKPYPIVYHKVPRTNSSQMKSAFTWMMDEFFPGTTRPHRTQPTCGDSTCINPFHRSNGLVTNAVLTPGQALEVYSRRGQGARGVAEEFGLSANQVLSIWRGRNWGEITGAPEYRPERKVTSPEVEAEIVERFGKASSRVIAAELGISYKTVLRVWNRHSLSRAQGV